MEHEKPTLEAAIRRTRVNVEIDEEMISIERQQCVQRQAENVQSTDIGQFAIDHMNDDDQNMAYDAKFWKRKCQVLYEEKGTLEKEFLRKFGLVLDKYDSLRAYTKLLEQKLQPQKMFLHILLLRPDLI